MIAQLKYLFSVRYFSLLVFLFSYAVVVAQEVDGSHKEDVKLLDKARYAYEEGELELSKDYYSKLLSKDSTNSIYLFEMGITVFDSPFERNKALPYFEKALKYSNPELIHEVYYYLGKTYHLAYRFDEAIESYNKFYDYVDLIADEMTKKEVVELKKELDQSIKMCEVGKKLVKKPVNVAISPLSYEVNSPIYPDYAPIISADESMMIFTSRREGSTGHKLDEDGKYFEDIYITEKYQEEWGYPEKFNAVTTSFVNTDSSSNVEFSEAIRFESPINTKYHDAVLGMSTDGQELFIYKKKKIYRSVLDGDAWSDPERLNSNINLSGRQPSLCFSADGKTMYFVSSDKNSIGGQDIYMSKRLKNGKWGRGINLGPDINTKFDEDAPFLHPDGKTLYFSSKGHESMGGYDVFKTVFDKKWGPVENLGYPINTSGDDIHFVINAKGDHAYYASAREKDGNIESMDIHMLLFEGVSVPVTQIKGMVVAGDENSPISASILVKDPSGKEIMTSTSNSSSGEYLLILPPASKYVMTISADGYTPQSDTIEIPDQKRFYSLYQMVKLYNIKDGEEIVGHDLEVKNAFFDVDEMIASDSVLLGKLNKEVSQKAAQRKEGRTSTDGELNVKGFIIGADRLKPIPATITITNKLTGEQINLATSTTDEGSYELFFPKNAAYKVEIAADGYVSYMQELEVPDQEKFCVLYQDLQLAPENKNIKLPKQKIDVQKAIECDPLYPENIRMPDEDYVRKLREDEETYKRDLFAALLNVIEKDNQLKEDIYKRQTDSTLLASDFFDDDDDVVVDTSLLASDLGEEEEKGAETEGSASGKDLIKGPDVADTGSEVGTGETGPIAVQEFSDLLFAFDSYRLEKNSVTILEEVLSYMQKNVSVRMKLIGHTDSKGSNAYNLKLSKRRADAAVNYLIAKGINKDRIASESLGESKPVAPNENADQTDNPAGRKLNRRVEITQQ